MKTLLSQKQRLLDLFQIHGNKLTLGQLLNDPSGVGYKCTSRFSELRADGYQIDFVKGDTPSLNTYILRHYDQKGQGSLI